MKKMRATQSGSSRVAALKHRGKMIAGGLISFIFVASFTTPASAFATENSSQNTLTSTQARKATKSRVTVKSLRRARVPALCNHPAGRLKKGVWTNPEPYSGGTYLLSAKFGKIRKGHGREAVAVIGCDMGGVGWPGNVVMYSAKTKIIGTIKLLDVVPGSRTYVHSVKIRKGKVLVDVSGVTQAGDGSLWGTADTRLVLKWNKTKKKFVVVKKTKFTEKKIFRKVIALARKGKTGAIMKRTGMSASDAAQVINVTKMLNKGKTYSRKRLNCTSGDMGERVCTYSGEAGKPDEFSSYRSGIAVTFAKNGWRKYTVTYVTPFG
ncbi:hypothetical protein SAMN06309944_0591 [Micrococcales bacterium KH10]|nr:hypothetical protein SAMN06309944_0591 [Micrococcales bacterium KH10]